MKDNRQLLSTCAAERSESAFAELVNRHIHLVYSAALMLGSPSVRPRPLKTISVSSWRDVPRGHTIPLGTLPGTTPEAAAIDSRGEIVGRAYNSEGVLAI